MNNSVGPMVSVRTSDQYDVEPGTASLTAGTGPFLVTLPTASTSHLIFAYDTSNTYSTGTATMFQVSPAPAARLHIVLPGETYTPGKPPYDGTGGKTNAPVTQTAGQSFTPTVYLTDLYYNIRSGDVSNTVFIHSSDPNFSAPSGQSINSGQVSIPVRLVTYNTQTVGATYQDLSISSTTSTPLYVQPNAPARMQIVAPGETSRPGKWNNGSNIQPFGKSGTPNQVTAGSSFQVTVTACDNYYNPTTAQPDATVTTTDPYDVEPATQTLLNGSTTFTITLVTQRVTIASATASGYTPDYTGNITVNAASASGLQIILPGETAVQGKWNVEPAGKTGAPAAATAGTPFSVTVRAIDPHFNLCNISQTIDLESNDPNDANHTGVPQQNNLSGGSATYNRILLTANTSWIFTATDRDPSLPSLNPAVSTPVWVNAGTPWRILALVPGETYLPGNTVSQGGGKGGSPLQQTAGVPFVTTVIACDLNWNNVPGETSVVDLRSTDNFADLPAGYQEHGFGADGRTTFTNTIYTASTQTFYASGVGEPVLNHGNILNPYTSSVVTVVSSDAVKMQVLLPGETYVAGKPPYNLGGGGKGGAPTQRVAGVPFNVTAREVDPYWNTVTSIVSQVRCDTDDPYDVQPAIAPLAGGLRIFPIDLVTASTWTITAVDTDDAAIAVNVSSPVYVAPNSADRLQVLLPGETAVAGKFDGKTGSATPRTAGVLFAAQVRLTDAYWNTIYAGAMPTVSLGSTDVYWSTPTAKTLVAGVVNFSGVSGLTLVTATTTTIFADGGGYTTGVSSPVLVMPNTATKTIVVVPGETQVNGKNVPPLGRSGTPATETAGQMFTITVYAVDGNNNFVNTVNINPVNIITSDIYDTDPGNLNMVNGLITTNVTIKTAKATVVSALPGGAPLAQGDSSSIPVVSGVARRLQVLLPGETADPGSVSGKIGSPGNQVAGYSFNVTVRTCDDYWNAVSTNPMISVYSDDINSPFNPAFSGQMVSNAVVSVMMVTASTNTYTVRADDIDGVSPDLISGISSGVRIVPGAPNQLLAIVPGEEFNGGTLTGKTGLPNVITAGTLFSARAAVCDPWWNRVSNIGVTIIATSPLDPYDVEPAQGAVDPTDGTASFLFTLHRAVTQYILATDANTVGQTFTANKSSVFSCVPALPIQLQVLLPGTTGVPGSVSGRIGMPAAQTAGAGFYGTVNVVDQFFNVATQLDPQPLVHINTSDQYDAEPSTSILVSGTNQFYINLRTAATSHFVVASDVDWYRAAL